MAVKEKVITVSTPDIQYARVKIIGDSDLVLNRKNAWTVRMLTAEDRKQFKQVPNEWENHITCLHWRDKLTHPDGTPVEDTYTECDEEMFYHLLKNNAPCISAFGMKKSFDAAVVRNEIDKYSTKFDANVNIVAERNLIPITFSEWALDELIMTPKMGAPITAKLHHFIGWEAEFTISYMETIFKLQSIINIIQLAGFGLGIGSGRSSGFGRYHVSDVISM